MTENTYLAPLQEADASSERSMRPGWDGIAVVSVGCALGLLIAGAFLVGFATGWDERQGGMSLRQTVLACPPLFAAGALMIVQIVRRGVTLSERSITTHGLFRPTREFLWSEIDRFEVKFQDVEEGPGFWSIAMVLRNGKGILLPLGPAYSPQRRTDRRVAELNRELRARRPNRGIARSAAIDAYIPAVRCSTEALADGQCERADEH